MANQYIGARYVPKFEDTWNNTLIYEPLVVVRYGNANYISIKEVPAGILPTNPNYWQIYSRDGVVSPELIADVNNLKAQAPNSIHFNVFENVNCIIVGDSFGHQEERIDYATQFKSMVELNGGICQNMSEGTASFINKGGQGHNYIEQYQAANNLSDVNLIIIEGFVNDYNQQEAALTAANTCIQTMKTSSPHARIIGLPVGRVWNSINYTFYDALGKIFRNNNCEWVKNAPFYVGSTEYLMPDLLHPNQEGYNRIYHYLCQYLLGGEFCPDLNYSNGGLIVTLREGVFNLVITNPLLQTIFTALPTAVDNKYSLPEIPFFSKGLSTGQVTVQGNETITGLAQIACDGDNKPFYVKSLYTTTAFTVKYAINILIPAYNFY